jgi:hypothetical protein
LLPCVSVFQGVAFQGLMVVGESSVTVLIMAMAMT